MNIYTHIVSKITRESKNLWLGKTTRISVHSVYSIFKKCEIFNIDIKLSIKNVEKKNKQNKLNMYTRMFG